MRKKNGYTLLNEVQYAVLAVPAFIIFTIGVVIPIFIGADISLTDWDGLTSTRNFIGLENYSNILKDREFHDTLKFTFLFTIANTIVQNVFAIAFALALDSAIKGKRFMRTVIFLPCLFSAVLVGYLWSGMYSEVFPLLNKIFNSDFNFNFFSDPDRVLTGLVITNNWQWIGYWMLIYLAALQSVPKELYEACTVDGAKPHHKFIRVTLPMIVPAITICIVGITTGSLKVFDLVKSATNGGPGHASESLVMYIYNMAFLAQQPAYATAMSIIFLLILLVICVIQLKLLREREVQV